MKVKLFIEVFKSQFSKLPLVKNLVNERGFIQSVKCMVCFLIESKDKIVGCKWDTLTKHANRGIAM
jgi:hypothetical protein